MRSILVFMLALAAVGAAAQGDARPSGRNCDLQAPPADAGEDAGDGGVLVQVYPRRAAIMSSYSGCQAVFFTPRNKPPTLAWLVDVQGGQPVRVWSTDPTMATAMSCRYRGGSLVSGDPGVCPDASRLLLPSMPAGCVGGTDHSRPCRYDDR